jgi:hypothetical protein
MLNDVMVDLETWGTSPGSMIRSLGAVFFDPETGQLGDEFYCNITETSCKKLKMYKEEGTVAFWAKPEHALANKQLSEGQLPIEEVVEKFAVFFGRGGRWFWSQGANFDEPLLSWVYRALGKKQPWRFHEAQDTRTIYRVSGLNTFSIKRQGTYHNALADCKHQVLCVSMGHKKLRGNLV